MCNARSARLNQPLPPYFRPIQAFLRTASLAVLSLPMSSVAAADAPIAPSETRSASSAESEAARDGEIFSDDPVAPSQEIPSDVRTDHVVVAAAIDPLGVVFGLYRATVEMAPLRHHGIWISGGWAAREDAQGVHLALAYHLLPLGRGVAGFFLGPVASVAWLPDAPFNAIGLGFEAGYQHTFGAFIVGGALGAEHRWTSLSTPSTSWAPRLRLTVGWSWS